MNSTSYKPSICPMVSRCARWGSKGAPTWSTTNDTETSPASPLRQPPRPWPPPGHLGHRQLPRQRRLQGPPPDGLARARPAGAGHGHRRSSTSATSPSRASTSASTLRGIDTREPKRDEHLRCADFFDVAHHPTVTFRSTRVEAPSGADGNLRVTGDLTMRGVTRPVTLEVEPLPPAIRTRGATAGAGVLARAPHQPQGLGPQVEPGPRGGRRGRRRRGRHRDRRRADHPEGLIPTAWGGGIVHPMGSVRRATCSSTRRTSRSPCQDRSRPAARARTRSAGRLWQPPRRRCRSHPRAGRSRRRPPRR